MSHEKKRQRGCSSKMINSQQTTTETKPIHLEFEYSVAGEGYWSDQHMALQLTECVDFLKALYPQEYDSLFLFDDLTLKTCPKAMEGNSRHCYVPIKQHHMYLGPHSYPLKPSDNPWCSSKGMWALSGYQSKNTMRNSLTI